jgi:DNA-binding LacI/PurR family transcriptional regulator
MKFKPLYIQVKERLREDFHTERGNRAVGRLPSLNELQIQYRVSRPTISKALAALTAEGLLVKEDGRGTFALAPEGARLAPPQDSSVGPSRLTIGYIAPLTGKELPQNAFRGIDRVGHRRDTQVLMASTRDNVENERAAAIEMIASGARGLIIYPTVRQGASQETDYLRHEDLGVPIVLIDTCTPMQGRAQVIFDNKRAGFQMTRWLIERGHRRIGVIFYTEEAHHPALDARFRGYQEAVTEAGLSWDEALVRRIPANDTYDGLEMALEGLLALPQPPTALIACHDPMAIEIIETLARHGVHVPDEIQVVGFDNTMVARRYQPAFATTSPDFEAMGEVACEMLLDAIQSGKLAPQTYLLPAPLLVRTQLTRHVPRALVRA